MDTKAAAHIILGMGARILTIPEVREASDAYTEALARAAREQAERADDGSGTPQMIGAILLDAIANISSMVRPGQLDEVKKLVMEMVDSVLTTAGTHPIHKKEPEVLH